MKISPGIRLDSRISNVTSNFLTLPVHCKNIFSFIDFLKIEFLFIKEITEDLVIGLNALNPKLLKMLGYLK